MGYIWEWVKNITLIVILFSFVEILLPGSSMGKYLKFIFSLAVLAMMVSPLATLGETDISVFGNVSVYERAQGLSPEADSEVIERVQTKQIETVYREKLVFQLGEELKENFPGISITSIEIYINNEVRSKGFGTPQRAELSIGDPEFEKVVRDYVAHRLQIEKRSVSITLTEE